ncbi:hypothetical protein ATN89_12215 [Comamonas thiooxydans]|uniref:hypothetical protein n=1 Tax=Comamonas thiooxydans TaxID=363952 RepID=UPI0007C493AE|nr:hypothetical protein [Comamonas thiooxydans]OAD83932.1 hypothetical protein ATN89_12215 [Comamonas thiooxydans]
MFGLSKPIPKDNGAKLAQAQNQAPDSIPGMFKPGEFVLPPDTVHAMGGKQALQGVVDATHTPVQASFGLNSPKASAPQTQAAPQLGLKPEVFFANGGAPEDQLQRSSGGQASPTNTFPQASPSAGAPVYSGAGFGRDQFGSSGQIAKVPDAIGQQPGRQMQAQAQPAPAAQPAAAPVASIAGASDAARVPQVNPAPPVAAPAAATRSPGPSELYMQDRAQEMRDQWGSGNYAQAAGTAARTAVQGLGMYGVELADKVGSPVVNAVGNFAGGLIGSEAHAAQQPASPATTPGTAPAASTKPAAAPVAAAAIQPGLTNTVGSAPRAAQAVTAASASGELPEGVYNHGRGQYSDQASGMGFPAGFTGKPNARNLAAAENLAASNAAPAVGGQPEDGGFGLRAPTVAHSGNDWAARQRLKDMETSASSITNRAEWRSGSSTPTWGSRHGQGVNDPDGKVARFNAATQADLVAQGKAPELQQRTNEVNAGLRRAAMAESGADRRAQGQLGLGLRRLDLDQQRNQLDAQRVASDERLRAPQIRAAERLGQLQESFVNAKTPEERNAIASQMRAYSGKDEADWKVQVTPATKNVDGSTTAGSVIRYNSRTGDVQEVDGVGGKPPVPAKDSLKAGQVYQTPRGQARWNGSEFELVG